MTGELGMRMGVGAEYASGVDVCAVALCECAKRGWNVDGEEEEVLGVGWCCVETIFGVCVCARRRECVRTLASS